MKKVYMVLLIVLMTLVGCGENEHKESGFNPSSHNLTPAEKSAKLEEIKARNTVYKNNAIDTYRALFNNNIIRSEKDCEYSYLDKAVNCLTTLGRDQDVYIWLGSRSDDKTYLADSSYTIFTGPTIGSVLARPLYCDLDSDALKNGIVNCTRYRMKNTSTDVDILLGNKNEVLELDINTLLTYYHGGNYSGHITSSNGITTYQIKNPLYRTLKCYSTSGKIISISDKDCSGNKNYCIDELYKIWLNAH